MSGRVPQITLDDGLGRFAAWFFDHYLPLLGTPAQDNRATPAAVRR